MNKELKMKILSNPENSVLNTYITDDHTVIKLIHDDDSETAIKIQESQLQNINPITGKLETFQVDRNKYSVFISASAGCPMKCSFCHLTIKNAKFKKLTRDEILNNLKSAIEEAIKYNTSLSDKYVKLSWMGMGEAILDPEGVRDISLSFIEWLLKYDLAKGLDGVDLSTVMPDIKGLNLSALAELNQELKKYNINPKNYMADNIQLSTFKEYPHRSPLRLFYSIHAINPKIRNILVPNTKDIIESALILNEWSNNSQANVILHQLILDGKNDSWDEISNLVSFINTYFQNNELRVLRYNVCLKSQDMETQHFNEIIKYLSQHIKYLKVQVSPGKEVSAACGQFIVSAFVNK